MKKDIKRITEITSEAFKDRSVKEMEDLLKEEARYRSETYVVEINKVVASSGRLIFPILMINGFGWKCGGIVEVCTDSRFRGKGLATTLMSHLINRMKELGITFSILFTELDSPAHYVYKKVGYFDIAKNPVYAKILNPDLLMKQWIWLRNHRIKFEPKAKKELNGWKRIIKFKFTDWKDIYIKFSAKRFTRIKKPLKQDIEIITNLNTFLTITNIPYHTRAVGDRVAFEKAIKKRDLIIKCLKNDKEIVRRILLWDWV